MKILHILPELNKGGAERLVIDICGAMQLNNSIQVQLVSFKPHNAYAFASKGLHITVVPSTVVPSLTGKWKIQVQELQQIINTFQPDVIHSHLFEAEIVLSQVDCGRALRVMHFHDNMQQLALFTWRTFFSKKRLTNWYERSIVLRNWNKLKKKCAIAIASDSEEYARLVLGSSTPIHKQLNAISINRFEPQTSKQKSATLCMIGSLVPKKNQQLAILTVAMLQQKGVSFELYILGDGPKKDELIKLSRKLKIEHLVHLVGNVDEPESYLHRSFVYLHTAWYEPLGLVLLEAMAAETPIVCIDGKGNRELIQHGVNGFIFQEQDPNLLAEQIIALWKDDKAYTRISENAKEFVRNFDIHTYCDSLLEIYEKEIQ